MNQPLEESPLPIMKVLVLSHSDLQETLFSSTAIINITISGLAMSDINNVTRLIVKHQAILKYLVLDGSGLTKANFSEEEISNLATAVLNCKQLTLLHIEEFGILFKNHIVHFAGCLRSLPDLLDLSFKNTCLHIYGDKLTPDLSVSKLKTLNLTNTYLLNDLSWMYLREGLALNSTLESLILGNSPFWDSAFFAIQSGIRAAKCNVKSLQWDPGSFYESENRYLFYSAQVNWDNDQYNSQRITHLRSLLEEFKKTGEHHLLTSYAKTYEDLKKLKSFSSLRHNPSLTSLTLVQGNDGVRNLSELSGFSIYKETLRELTLSGIKKPEFVLKSERSWEIEGLAEAIKACQKLEILKMENAKGAFTGYIQFILHAIAALPNLRVLSLSNTYIGEKGVEVIAFIIKKNKLEELDLSHCALINANCFLILAKALENNTSLKRIKLGSSPMTHAWIKILATAFVNNNANLPEITWQLTTVQKMNQDMCEMCHQDNCKLYANADLAYCYQQFTTQSSPEILGHWSNFVELQRHKKQLTQGQSTHQRVNEKLQVVIGEEPKEKNEATESTPLTTAVKSSTSQQRRYGAAAEIEMVELRPCYPQPK